MHSPLKRTGGNTSGLTTHLQASHAEEYKQFTEKKRKAEGSYAMAGRIWSNSHAQSLVLCSSAPTGRTHLLDLRFMLFYLWAVEDGLKELPSLSGLVDKCKKIVRKLQIETPFFACGSYIQSEASAHDRKYFATFPISELQRTLGLEQSDISHTCC